MTEKKFDSLLDLGYNTIHKIEMPTNTIDEEGKDEIKAAVRRELHLDIDDEVNLDEWVVPRGEEFIGTLPKRIGNWAWKRYGYKCSPAMLSEIGNIAKRHTVDNATHYISLNKEIDWERGDFGDEGSCFWSERREVLDVFYTYNVIGLRFHDPQYTDPSKYP